MIDRTMDGETDLEVLLSSMQPLLHDSAYVYCSLDQETFANTPITPLFIFWEKEGIAVVVTREQAVENGFNFEKIWAYIELSVHSSLSAVGFIAAVSSRLAQAGISLNVVSAYFHDHLFVPWESRERVMQLLRELSHAK